MHLCEVGRRSFITPWILTLACAAGPLWGQTAVEAWQFHAPFREADRVAVLHDRVLAMSTYGLMSLEFDGRVLTSYSTVEGLSGVGLTSLAASPDGRFALIGYEDGRIDRWTPNEVRTLDDVPRSGQFQGRTAVREWAFASPSRVFAAADFGLLELDLNLNVVRGTYRMRADSEPLKVRAVAVLGSSIRNVIVGHCPGVLAAHGPSGARRVHAQVRSSSGSTNRRQILTP